MTNLTRGTSAEHEAVCTIEGAEAVRSRMSQQQKAVPDLKMDNAGFTQVSSSACVIKELKRRWHATIVMRPLSKGKQQWEIWSGLFET